MNKLVKIIGIGSLLVLNSCGGGSSNSNSSDQDNKIESKFNDCSTNAKKIVSKSADECLILAHSKNFYKSPNGNYSYKIFFSDKLNGDESVKSAATIIFADSDAGKALSDIEMEATGQKAFYPFMFGHNHGLLKKNAKKLTTIQDTVCPNVFHVDNLHLHMPGKWTFTLKPSLPSKEKDEGAIVCNVK